MSIWENFWNIVWLFFWSSAVIAYLFALFAVIADLVRDRNLSGWWKAVWIFFLIFVPFVTALIYLIARGTGMAERSLKETRQVKEETDSYIRKVASTSPTDDIAKAKALMDDGAITVEEFNRLKNNALGRQTAAGTDTTPARPSQPTA